VNGPSVVPVATTEHPRDTGNASRWLQAAGLVRHARVTAVTVALMLVVQPWGPQDWGTGLTALAAGRWWTLLTAGLVTGGPTATVLTILLTVAVLVPAERRWGSVRTAAALLAALLVVPIVGLLLIAALAAAGSEWGAQLATGVVVGPLPAVLALAGAVSAGWAPLWRRRTRAGLSVVLAMLVLYAGSVGDVLSAVGLAAGTAVTALVATGSRHPSRPAVVSRRESRTLVALLVAAAGVGPLIAALSITPDGPWAVVSHLFVSEPPSHGVLRAVCGPAGDAADCQALRARLRLTGFGPALASVLPVLLQLVLAEGLRRGRRAAWVGMVMLSAALTAVGAYVVHSVLDRPAEEWPLLASAPGSLPPTSLLAPLLAPGLVLLLLLVTRTRFDVRSAPGSAGRWAALAAGGIALVLVCYVGVGLMITGNYATAPGPGRLLLDLPARLLPPGYLGEMLPRAIPLRGPARVLAGWTGIACWAVLVGTAWSVVRPAVPSGDAARARAVVARHGEGALSYMTTWTGNRWWFATDGTMVAFRVIGRVALTTGNPVGPPAGLAGAVAEFTDWCNDRGWIPCWYSVTDDVADALPGACRVQVATETWLPLGDLAFVGKRWQDVRTALNRAARDGITTQWLHWTTTPLDLREQLTRASEEWLAAKGLPEMGFTLGSLDELADPAVRGLVALDASGAVLGLTSWLPARRDDAPVGWTLDLMRRTPGCPAGVMELLIATAALTFQDEGAEFVSLSGAPLAVPPAEHGADGLERLLQATGRLVEPLYGFRSLMAFKAKFQPRHRALWLVYPDAADLPRIATAVSKAYLPHLSPQQAARLARALLVARPRPSVHRPAPPTRTPTPVGTGW
jgi:phosphatidylglycerol lysyltransferase